MWAFEERERDQHAANQTVRKRETEVPTRSTSSGDGEIEQGGGGSTSHVSLSCGLFSASRLDTPVDMALIRQTPIKMPLSRGWAAFRPIQVTPYYAGDS
jgi:hypothetical protein